MSINLKIGFFNICLNLELVKFYLTPSLTLYHNSLLKNAKLAAAERNSMQKKKILKNSEIGTWGKFPKYPIGNGTIIWSLTP